MSEQTPDGSEWTSLDRHAVDTARLLAADAVQKVGNGHPGTAMSLAPAACTIFQKVMLEEGVSAEASSLAGHQKLGNLVILYDDNHISIEGDTATAFSEDVLGRYEAYGWHTLRIEPAENGDVDVHALHAALTAARAVGAGARRRRGRHRTDLAPLCG
jgi:transketolase